MGKLIVFILSLVHHCILHLNICVWWGGGGSDQRNQNPDPDRKDVYPWEILELEMNIVTDEMLGYLIWEWGGGVCFMCEKRKHIWSSEE